MKPDIYLAVKDCGCIAGAVMNRTEYSEDTADAVAEFIKQGMSIVSTDMATARRRLAEPDCQHKAQTATATP